MNMSDAEACTMKNEITELAQSHDLLIANGNETANLLRHLANNEIDSDYFAVVSECESYGQETDAELSITEFALRAAGFVDALVDGAQIIAWDENGNLLGVGFGLDTRDTGVAIIVNGKKYDSNHVIHWCS